MFSDVTKSPAETNCRDNFTNKIAKYKNTVGIISIIGGV